MLNAHFYDAQSGEIYRRLYEQDIASLSPEERKYLTERLSGDCGNDGDKEDGAKGGEGGEKGVVMLTKPLPQVLQEIAHFVQMSSVFSTHLQKGAIDTLYLFHRDAKNNVDANGVNVENLLPLIWRRIDKRDHAAVLYFVEQLADVSQSGPCSNGRINRLLQLYSALL